MNPDTLLLRTTLTVCLTTLLALIIGALFKGLGTTTAILCLTLGPLAAWLIKLEKPSSPPKPTKWDILLLVIFCIYASRIFSSIVQETYMGWTINLPHNWGDIAIHIHMIKRLASGEAFWPESTLLSGTPMSYPIGMNLFNCLPEILGVPTDTALVWTGLIASAAIGYALYRWGGAIAIAALLFNGGLVALLLFLYPTPIPEVLGLRTNTPTTTLWLSLWGGWSNLFGVVIANQRNFLYALPCGLLLLHLWRKDFFQEGSKTPPLLQTLLYSTLPLFSPQTFLFLSTFLGFAFLLNPELRKRILTLVLPSIPIATTLLWLVLGGGSTHTAPLRWDFGWTLSSSEWKEISKILPYGSFPHVWTYWIAKFGITTPLVALVALQSFRKGASPETRTFVWSCLLTIIFSFTVSLHTWQGDNIKLLLWAWICLAPFLGALLKNVRAPIKAAAYFLLFASGVTTAYATLQFEKVNPLAPEFVSTHNPHELPFVRTLLAPIPNSEPILTDPSITPLHYLGRKLVAGHEQHILSHNLPEKGRIEEVKAIMALARSNDPEKQSQALARAKKLGASVIYVPEEGLIGPEDPNFHNRK